MRYTSEGPGGKLGAAIMPVPARLGQGYQSWGEVNGSPGTDNIPSPAPAAVPQSFNRALHRSSDAPDVWKPGIYYQPHLASTPTVARESDNQMPIPSRLPNGNYGFVASGNSKTFKVPSPGPIQRKGQVGQPFVTPAYRWSNR